MNRAQSDQIIIAISDVALARFRSGLAMMDPKASVDEQMEAYERANKLVDDAYRLVRDVYAGDVAPDGL